MTYNQINCFKKSRIHSRNSQRPKTICNVHIIFDDIYYTFICGKNILYIWLDVHLYFVSSHYFFLIIILVDLKLLLSLAYRYQRMPSYPDSPFPRFLPLRFARPQPLYHQPPPPRVSLQSPSHRSLSLSRAEKAMPLSILSGLPALPE